MAAEIIQFPKSKKQLELETMKSYSSVVPNIAGVPVTLPKTGKQFLELCKQFLEPEDYMDVLCGILDKEHFDALEPQLQKIINSYYSFGR